ncbi:sugar-transfer associated ATP-grasp domain-containing protein [Nitrospira sp. M1]
MNFSAILARARQAKSLSGKGLLAQAIEMARLHRSPGKIGPSEYFDYGLFDDQRFDELAKQEFIGWSRESFINNTFNKVEWGGLSLDKIVFYTFMEGAGIPYPRIQAIFDMHGRFIKGIPTFASQDTLATYLKNQDVYPIFVKPSHGNFGRGAHYLSAYHSEDESVVFANGTQSTLAEFIGSLETTLSGGQIFQDVFKPHPDLASRCGARSSTMRVVVIITKQGPQLCRAVWKIPTGSNIIDNFQHGRTGNLLASVDVKTGDVYRVIGHGADGEFTEISIHPDTGIDLMPLRIPDWAKAEDLCLTAARLLPGLRLLHFDVAIADTGPLLLEVNFRGNLDLLQHASGKGFLSPEVHRALEDHAVFRQEIASIVQRTMREQQGSSGA